jgi:hypothetical protein
MGKNKKKSVSNNNSVDLSVEGVIESVNTVDFTSKINNSSRNKDPESAFVTTAETTLVPSAEPTVETTLVPSAETTAETTLVPSAEPSVETTAEPTAEPSAEPSVETKAEPSVEHSAEPSVEPKCQILLIEPKSETSGDNKIELIEISIKPDEQKKETLETEVSPNCNRRLCSIL